MRKINWARVALGGILAGVVLIALAVTSTVLFGGSKGLSTGVHALFSSATGSAAPLFFLCVFLVLGMLMIWWYAAMRPLFGPGPKTAVIAAFALWVTVIWLGVVGFAVESLAMGAPYSLPSGPMLPILYLVIMVASTIAGAWVYKEQN
jgi:hypothetical protein